MKKKKEFTEEEKQKVMINCLPHSKEDSALLDAIKEMSDEERIKLFKSPTGIMTLYEKIRKESKPIKTINISKKRHDQLKLASSIKNISMVDLVDAILNKALKSILPILVLFVMVSCSTVRYVEVDPVNMKRFQHKQKIEAGMTEREVLEMLGSPDDIKHKYMVSKGVTCWEYYKKIFCSGYRCYVYFDRDSKVMFTHDVRMEFDKTLINLD